MLRYFLASEHFLCKKIICQDEIPVLSVDTFGIYIVGLENFS